jgi:tRNA G37 N-methylase Trm5
MNEDKLIMLEVQTDMMDLLAKYPNTTDQAIAMCFKLILDCYVATMGEEDTQKLLKHAVESVKSGNHSHLYENLPKNLIN